ncbi:MAG: SLC13 family permease, partial [Salibacteraceae bacterium]|nr:SLC13 family permease [Salibacteraceae bacterium]MDP4935080.1 SLC13 family permease [Salibacteraceae bacterium]
VMIPVTTQIAKNANRAASKLLIPVSYASIFGGTCTLIGTSTNILVNGIAEQNGIEAFSMFSFTPLGLIFVAVGSAFMILFGQRLLPSRKAGSDSELETSLLEYLAEIEILPESGLSGKSILSSPLVKELEIEILELRRQSTTLNLPQGDTVLMVGDILKVRCNVEKIRQVKDSLKVKVMPFSDENADSEDQAAGSSAFVELVIPTNSELEGKTLREFDFRRRFRASPLAIRHREEVLQEQLQDVKLRAGDVILCEMKSHYLAQHKGTNRDQNVPFIILSEQGILNFNRKQFYLVMSIVVGVIFTASVNLLPIVTSTMLGVIALVLTGVLNMKEVYRSIQWPIVFLLAGALSLGVAMQNSGLAEMIAKMIVDQFSSYGPVAILAGIYLLTSILTELMSNNATAALVAPLSIATALQLGLSPVPFLVATMFAASSSFMTPIGYQTNTMIYSAGGYKFKDFMRVGIWLNLLFWIISVALIPYFFPF